MAKARLLYWYLETFLPRIAAKGTIFSVLIALLKSSPDDLSSFRMSNRKLAIEAGVNLRRIPDAIRELETRGVLLVVTEGKWSDRGPQAAVIPQYSLVPVEDQVQEALNSPIAGRDKQRGQIGPVSTTRPNRP
jgi:hypothetical protein